MEEETTLRKISFSSYPGSSTIDEVIRMLQDLTPTEKIDLVLMFMNRDGFRFSETVELRELVFEKNSNIHYLEVFDCLDFFVQFLLANSGETKHFLYFDTIDIPMQLDQAIGLSNAIRSDKNNNGNIESFLFSVCFDSGEVFQPVLDALLATGVRDLKLFLEISENNKKGKNGGDDLDFSNISTNTSLKELKVHIYFDLGNLFDSIKGNQTIEKLTVNSRYGDGNLDNKENRAFKEMLLKNTTLIHVELTDVHYNPILWEEINIHTTLNQIWKRLIIVKQKERIAAAATTAAAAIRTTATTVAITAVERRREEQDNNIHEVDKMKKIEEEKKMIKKKKEMNLWLKTFENKPVICNELIYLFLTENADMYNSNVSSSIVIEERKRKRHK